MSSFYLVSDEGAIGNEDGLLSKEQIAALFSEHGIIIVTDNASEPYESSVFADALYTENHPIGTFYCMTESEWFGELSEAQDD